MKIYFLSTMESGSYRTNFLIAAIIIIFVMETILLPANPSAAQTPLGSTTTTPPMATQHVTIGQGSTATVQHFTFTPQTIEINTGDSVTWFSPDEFVDVHTVTFVGDPSIQSDILLPFAIPAGLGATDFDLLPPFNLGEPVTIPSPQGREAIVAMNKIAWYPSVVDTNNQTIYLNGTDIQYTMDGTGKVVNSGIILPRPPTAGGAGSSAETGEPQMGPPFPPVNSFTATFAQAGTYPYFCAIHPWMSGQVIVREGGGEAANQATAGTPPTPTSPFSAEVQRQEQQQQQQLQQPQTPTEGQLSDRSETTLVGEEEEEQQEEVEEMECDPSYPDVCIPSPPPDLNCGNISERRFTVLSPDPHEFDGRDNDGIGCES